MPVRKKAVGQRAVRKSAARKKAGRKRLARAQAITAVRGSGVLQVTKVRDGVELRVLANAGSAIRLGVSPAIAHTLFGAEPNQADCPSGYEVHLHPDGGFVFTCIQDASCAGECHIFTRPPYGDWTDRGKQFYEKDLFNGFIVCGCTGGRGAV